MPEDPEQQSRESVMRDERDLAEELRKAVGQAEDLDVAALIAGAQDEARAEVAAHLKRLFVDELLSRALRQLEPRWAPSTEPSVCLAGVVEAGSEAARGETVGVAELRALITEAAAVELEDAELLERRVHAHNELLLAALEAGPVVPIPFGMFFASTLDVAAWLERNEQPLLRELARLRETTEWGLTIVEAAPVLAGATPESAPAASYLERRLAEGEEAARRQQTLAGQAEAWHEQLVPLAQDSRLNTERSGTLLEGAYLVRDSRRNAFDAVVAEIQAEASSAGLEARLTGPWPPFSFVTEELR